MVHPFLVLSQNRCFISLLHDLRIFKNIITILVGRLICLPPIFKMFTHLIMTSWCWKNLLSRCSGGTCTQLCKLCNQCRLHNGVLNKHLQELVIRCCYNAFSKPESPQQEFNSTIVTTRYYAWKLILLHIFMDYCYTTIVYRL